MRRSALFLCVEASRREASTMLQVMFIYVKPLFSFSLFSCVLIVVYFLLFFHLQLRTQAIRALMKRWNIPHVSIDSSPHALVPNAGDEARSSNHSNIQEKLVTTKPQRYTLIRKFFDFKFCFSFVLCKLSL